MTNSNKTEYEKIKIFANLVFTIQLSRTSDSDCH